jgi:predicted transcriptional regulator of viral defense system
LVRRIGWLVEQFGEIDDLEALRQAARIDLGEPTLLDPASRKRGRADRDWAIRVNRAVEPDV